MEKKETKNFSNKLVFRQNEMNNGIIPYFTFWKICQLIYELLNYFTK